MSHLFSLKEGKPRLKPQIRFFNFFDGCLILGLLFLDILIIFVFTHSFEVRDRKY